MYQHKIMEIITDPGSLSNYANEDGINHFFSNITYDEKIDTLRGRLLERLQEIIQTKLTSHQRKIVLLFLEGNTQEEIASVMNIHQTGVHKALHGNIDYGSDKRRYGGIVKKLKKICLEDKEVSSILSEIIEYKSEEV